MFDIQLIGLLAFCVLVLSFYRKTVKEILLFQITSNIAYAVHYLLLGALTGAYISIISVIRNICILKFENKKVICGVFIVLYLIITIIFYEGLYSILPMLANVIYLLHLLNKDRKILLRGEVICAFMWFLYGIFVLSYSEMITEMILCISSMMQLRKLKNTD